VAELSAGGSTWTDLIRASGQINGNFPGATAHLKWDLILVEGLIARLEIAP
jgi:hypothetical protein